MSGLRFGAEKNLHPSNLGDEMNGIIPKLIDELAVLQTT